MNYEFRDLRRSLVIGMIIISGVSASAQHDYKPTSSFLISGEVKAPVTIQLSDLKKWKEVAIGDVGITNHLREKKSEAKALKGVLLTDVLSSVEINSGNPKVLSEYYFICRANDGYTVVYSWNELFNTSVGETVYIVTEKEGKPASAMQDAIVMISPKDYATGRRHVKALESIMVKRAK